MGYFLLKLHKSNLKYNRLSLFNITVLIHYMDANETLEDVNFSRMLRVFWKKKSWKQHCTKQQLPIHKPSKMKKTCGPLVQKKGKTRWPNRANLFISALSLSLSLSLSRLLSLSLSLTLSLSIYLSIYPQM